jgi:hypothetical protein
MAGLIRRLWTSFTLIMLTTTLILCAFTVHSQQRRQAQNRSQSKQATAKTASTRWYTFRGPDNDFTIDFPNKPSRAEDVQGPVTILRRYVSTTHSTYFEISIQDFGGGPNSPEANSYDSNFEQNLSQLLTKDGFRIVQLRRTAKNIYEMEAWSPLQPGKYQHNLARGVLRYGRQYRMGCNSLVIGQKVDRSVCRRFFNSFHIIGVPQ